MNGNGAAAAGELKKIELHGTRMDCDYCGKPMDFAEYSSHQCDGLNGLNPWQEKTKHAVWHKPGMLDGAVNARGEALTPSHIIEARRRRLIRLAMRCFIAAALVLVALIYTLYG